MLTSGMHAGLRLLPDEYDLPLVTEHMQNVTDVES